uniref:peptide-methionine (S)-S-oxide reductase n=1 Tax=Leptocylindrus aporus TaxID=1398097 RepID=A0A6T5V5V7_9STRA|mmetsp:Transcript_1086/g.1444  ORF Transcript_1086/g.1444 Transcript_1086/m.1444 type:complete len:201 (+) Transcript_1086:277-879(+)
MDIIMNVGYWGTEKFIKKDFQKKFPKSIKSAKVGFMSPDPNALKNPNYTQVCSGVTGYVEVLYVELANPNAQIFENLVKFFFSFHDPTTLNRQGNDRGTQYASYIFTTDRVQHEIAEKVISELQDCITAGKIESYATKTLSTKLSNANKFYEAHAEHQEYLAKNPSGYCNHFFRFRKWPKGDSSEESLSSDTSSRKCCVM